MAEVHTRLVGAGMLGAALLGGCTMIPEYTRPEAPVAESFPVETETGGIAAADLGWRDVFADERLQRLLELALENNRDLRAAALNVDRFHALYRIERAPLYPSLGANGSVTLQELPASIPSSRFAPDAQWSANLGMTAWELDFFGRIRSLSEQALQQYFATAEARRSVHVSLIAQVAIAHFDERALAEQLELARRTMETVMPTEAGDTIGGSPISPNLLMDVHLLSAKSPESRVETREIAFIDTEDAIPNPGNLKSRCPR